jgi:DNA-binding transcriptional LysR family regulator
VPRLRAGELDLALVYQFPIIEALVLDGVDCVHLLDDRLYVALPRDHRLARRRRIKLRELADDAWIQGVHRGSTVAVLPSACRAAGFEPKIVFRSDDHMAVEGFVAAGLGVALVPGIALATARRDIAIRPLEVDGDLLTRQVGAATPPGSYRPPAVAAMIDVLQRVGRRVEPQAGFRRAGRQSA